MGAALATSDLAQLEEVIASGLRTFVGAGRALARIRDEKLYQGEYRSFEAYCADRWGFTKSRASQLITSASVVYNCKQVESGLPANEGQARELARLPAEKQSEAWAEAVKTAPKGKITAKHVAAVVAERMPEPLPLPVPAPIPIRPAKRASVKPEPVKPEPTRPEPEPVAPSPPDTSVSTEALSRLALQRSADPDYMSLRAFQAAMTRASGGTRGQRMIDFVLDGGELALLRLGLDWSVTEETLKRAHRAASRIAHPDSGGSQAEFVAVNQAHQLVRAMLGLA